MSSLWSTDGSSMTKNNTERDSPSTKRYVGPVDGEKTRDHSEPKLTPIT
jgi:hypothetical protein